MVIEDGQDAAREAASVDATAGRSAATKPGGRRRAASKTTVDVAVTAAGPADDPAAAVATPPTEDEPRSPNAPSAPDDRGCALPNDLRAVPLFASLSEANLASLARSVRKRQAAVGDVLCREGERGDEMYIILRGAVTLQKLVDNRDTPLGRLESGAHFGEMALIGEAPRSATIVADDAVDYLAIDRDTLMTVIAAYPTVALQILRGYNERLANTTERLARLSARLGELHERPRVERVQPALDPDAQLRRLLEQVVLFGPHPLAVLARRLLVETAWNRKILLALDVYELTVKYTVFLLVADYLRRPGLRAPDVDQMVIAAFRRPTLGLLLDMCPKILRTFASHGQEPFVPGLAALHLRPEGGRSESGRALHALTNYRNRLKHGAEGVWDEETFRADFDGSPDERLPNGEKRLGLKHHLATILEAVGFLRDYPLVYVSAMTYEHGAFEYAYERCTGAYTSFDRGVFAGREPLENRRLYVLSHHDERAMPIDPFMKRQRCPACATSAIFLLFSAAPDRDRPRRDAPEGDARRGKKERLEYLSYACGHTLVDQVSVERLERGEGISPLFD